MARITCAYSGVVFNCEHMPISLQSREYHHPLFSLPKKKLVSLAGDWAAGKLTPTESYLLYLSLFHSTDLIVWRAPAQFTPATLQIVSNNMENLLRIVGKLDLIKHPSFTLPKFAISHDTGDLTNSYYWIESWNQNFEDWYSASRESRIREETKAKLEIRSSAVEKLLRSFYANPARVAHHLGEWAQIAANFPTFSTIHPLTSKPISVSDYWKELIKSCVDEDKIWSYPRKDLSELLDHCEDQISDGGIKGHMLLKVLRLGLKKQDDYLGFANFDLGTTKTTFRILSPESSVEDANILSAISRAPNTEPVRSEYPNSFAYLKAKSLYDMAKRHAK